MTQEEKVQAYDKALEGIEDYIKSLKNVNDGIWSARDIENSLSEIFPQLKESEDERIRKALIRFHKSTIDVDGIKGEDIIAWLEKQGKQNDVYTKQQLRDMGFSFTTNGDIVTPDAEKENLKKYLEYKKEQWEKEQGEQKDVYTKQQLRDMGFEFTPNDEIVTPEKTREAIKEYLAIEKKKWEKEQKPAEWSKEDASLLNTTILYLDNTKSSCAADCIPYIAKCIEWLKSLRPQKQWKPSEVQVRALECGIDDVRFCNLGKERLPILNELLEQLRALL